MDNTNHDKDEPLAEGLDVLPESAFEFPKPSEAMKDALFERTGQVVKARARSRRFIRVVIVAAAYVAGITTAFLIADRPSRLERTDGFVVEGSAGHVDPASGNNASFEERIVGPDELVLRSKNASERDRVRLLTRAGDLYLSAQYDVEKALSCYSKALDDMPAPERTRPAPEDTWLLAALKDSRR